MGEIKARAFDSYTGQFMYLTLKNGLSCPELTYKPRNGHFFFKPWQLFSGLKDKNGKEIWGGDVVKTSSGVMAVEFGDDIACFECVSIHGSRGLYGYVKEGIEVIGNVFENPELLEKGGEG